MKPRIVATCRVHDQVLDRLRESFEVAANPSDEPWPEPERRSACAQADGLLAFMTDRIDRDFLQACPRLKIVAACLKGGDNIDAQACAELGIALHRSGDLLTEPTAELALASLLSLARGIPAGDRLVRTGAFQGWRPTGYGRTLRGSEVFVAGLGRVGRAVGRNLLALGARVRGLDASPLSTLAARSEGIQPAIVPDLAGAGMLVLCLPLEPSTFRWLDEERISLLAQGALVVNVGRGSTVDEAAVSRALASGRLGGYASDVYAFEDLSLTPRPSGVPSDWILSDRTLLTPHLGSAVGSARLAIELEAVRALEGALLT